MKRWSQELPFQVYKGKETNQMVCLIYTKPGTGGKFISLRVSRSRMGESDTDLYYYTPDFGSAQPQLGPEPSTGGWWGGEHASRSIKGR